MYKNSFKENAENSSVDNEMIPLLAFVALFRQGMRNEWSASEHASIPRCISHAEDFDPLLKHTQQCQLSVHVSVPDLMESDSSTFLSPCPTSASQPPSLPASLPPCLHCFLACDSSIEGKILRIENLISHSSDLSFLHCCYAMAHLDLAGECRYDLLCKLGCNKLCYRCTA